MKNVNYSIEDAEFFQLPELAEIALKVEKGDRLTLDEAKVWKNNLESF